MKPIDRYHVAPLHHNFSLEQKEIQKVTLSVIITTYNRPDTLVKVLNGLIGQVTMPGEVLVADDGSTDETRKVISEMRERCPFPVLHVWQEDQGFRLARIRNKAIQVSSGKYIVMLDGDCVPDPRFVMDHLSLAENGCFFQGKRILVQKVAADAFTHRSLEKNRMKLFFSKNIGNRHHLIHIPFFPASRSVRLSGIRGCNMGFFRKDIFNVNGYNEDFIGWGREDSELAVRFFKAGLKRKEHPFKALCYHLWHPEQFRERLEINDILLKNTINTDNYKCANGLVHIR